MEDKSDANYSIYREFHEGKDQFPFAVVIQPNGKWKSFYPTIDEKRNATQNKQAFLSDLKEASK